MTSKVFKIRKIIRAFIGLLNLSLFSTLISAQEQCRTPNNANGYCLPHSQCTNYFDYFKTTNPNVDFANFLTMSRCNSDPNTHLCCNELYLSPSSLIGTSAYPAEFDERGVQILAAQDRCGSSWHGRIAGGHEARLGSLPWMALLEYNVTGQPYLCGGSLITNRFVLTAAHCIKIEEKVIGVVLGEHNLDTDPDCQNLRRFQLCMRPAERFGVERVIPHPEYQKYNIEYDIGLIKLDADVTFKRHIRPICLPLTPFSHGMRPEGYFVAGWGTTESGQTSRLLLYAMVTAQESATCQDTYKRVRITDHHLCAGGNGLVDSCKGDSGGPLFISALYLPGKSRFIQYGIVSFGGTNCSATEKFPAIYTNVTLFMPWITKNIIV